jgi:D-proline reductase (dithiol) PrdB
LDRLKEIAASGAIGSVAAYHYSFMGATDPAAMESGIHEIAGFLKGDRVDAALLVPV